MCYYYTTEIKLSDSKRLILVHNFKFMIKAFQLKSSKECYINYFIFNQNLT